MMLDNGTRVVGRRVDPDWVRGGRIFGGGTLGELDRLNYTEFRALATWKKLQLLTDAYKQKKADLQQNYWAERTAHVDLAGKNAAKKMREAAKEWKQKAPAYEKRLEKFEKKIEELAKRIKELPEEEKGIERVERYLEGPREGETDYDYVRRCPLGDFNEGREARHEQKLVNQMWRALNIQNAERALQIIGMFGDKEDLAGLKKYRPPAQPGPESVAIAIHGAGYYYEDRRSYDDKEMYYEAEIHIEAAIKQIERRIGREDD